MSVMGPVGGTAIESADAIETMAPPLDKAVVEGRSGGTCVHLASWNVAASQSARGMNACGGCTPEPRRYQRPGPDLPGCYTSRKWLLRARSSTAIRKAVEEGE